MLKKFKIGKKLLLSHGAMFLVFILIAGHVTFELYKQKTDSLWINIMGRQRMLIQKITKELFLLERKAIDVAAFKNTIQLFDESLTTMMIGGNLSLDLEMKNNIKIEKIDNEEIQKALVSIKSMWDKFHGYLKLYIEKRDTENWDYLMDNNITILNEFNRLTKVIEEKVAFNTQMLYYEMSIGLVIFILVFIFSLFISKSIVRPIEKLVETFKKGAQGDLTERVEVNTQDEIGELASYYNRFADSLSEILIQIKDANRLIINGISELVQGNQDLSARVDAQSASLEQTASAIEQMTANLKNTADNSAIAKKVGAETEMVAKLGEEDLNKMVLSMKNITDQTVKIKDIVKIIEGIAFQTNILALNAAVEAARAKEHGKGFAVVANEVRNLAQKSAENSKQISEMIENIVSGIEAGNKQVLQSQARFAEINEKIKKVSAVIQEVANATEEQANGVDQINQAVSHLDEITQNNASLVEEVAASSEELEKQAQGVLDLIQFFKIKSGITGKENKKQEIEEGSSGFIKWEDKYSVRIEQMDDHHKKLLGIINKLYDAMKAKKAKDVLLKITRELLEYTKYHFGAEENLMKQYSYPGYEEQRVQHQKFIDKITAVEKDLESGKTLTLSTNLLTFLKDWLVNHIMKIDSQYSDYLNQRGVY